MRYIKNICFKNIPRRMISELMANFKIAISHRGERGHAGHVPDGTSSITEEGDEIKQIKMCEMKNFITNIGYKFQLNSANNLSYSNLKKWWYNFMFDIAIVFCNS